MSPYIALPILAGIALLQTTLAPHLSFIGAKPQFMLLAVVSWSLLRGGREGVVWAFAGGVMLDLLSGSPFGVITLPLLLVGYLSGLGEFNVFRASFLLPGLVIIGATLFHNALTLSLLRLLGETIVWKLALMNVVLPAVVLNSLALPFIYVPLHRFQRHAGQPQMNW